MAIVGYLVLGMMAYSVGNFIFERYYQGKKTWVDNSPYMKGIEKEIWLLGSVALSNAMSELLASRLANLLGITPFSRKLLDRLSKDLKHCGLISPKHFSGSPSDFSDEFLRRFSDAMAKNKLRDDLSLQAMRDFFSESVKNTLRSRGARFCDGLRANIKKTSLHREAIKNSMKFNYPLAYLSLRRI